MSRAVRDWLLALAVLLVLCIDSCQAADSWTTPDKPQHVAVSAGIGVLTSGLTASPYKAFGLCMVPGIAKELTDKYSGMGQGSFKDLAADALGCAAGVKLGRFIAFRSHGRTGVVWSSEF